MAGTPWLTHSGEARLEPTVENFVLGQAGVWPPVEGRWQRTISTQKDVELTPLQHSWVQNAVTARGMPGPFSCPPVSLGSTSLLCKPHSDGPGPTPGHTTEPGSRLAWGTSP